MDEELNRRMVALEAAEREWREHRLTGYELGYEGGGPSIGTATGQPFTREWREREALGRVPDCPRGVAPWQLAHLVQLHRGQRRADQDP